MATSNNSKVKWNALLDAIEAEKCVLCIGPGIFTNNDGAKLEDQIKSYLEERSELDDDIICYPDGLFYFRRESKRNNILSDLNRFFKKDFPEVDELYKKLIRIPFNLILFLTPDQKYTEIAKAQGLPIHSDFYFKKQPPRSKDTPTKNHPIAYNLFGSFRDDESIMLTYDDLFDFMQSTFEGKSMSETMRLSIRNARHFICLGLPFDKWYMQLLLRVLEIHTNRRLTKYATSGILDNNNIQEFFKDQFDIIFVKGKVNAFVDQMYAACEEDGLIRQQVSSTQSRKAKIATMVSRNMLKEALKEVENNLVNENRLSDEFSDEIALLKRRLKFNADDKVKGIVPDKEYKIEQNRIADEILNFSKEYF